MYGKQFAEYYKVANVSLLNPQNSYGDYNHQPKLEYLVALMVTL